MKWKKDQNPHFAVRDLFWWTLAGTDGAAFALDYLS
jgi:hypothetical protein